MYRQDYIYFEPFLLDEANECLRKGDEFIPLRPKSMAVLRYLLERPGQLVKKEELIESVWPDSIVGDDSLKGCIREIRRALGDDAVVPHFIETAHRRGYRFIGQIDQRNTTVTNSVVQGSPKPLERRMAVPGEEGFHLFASSPLQPFASLSLPQQNPPLPYLPDTEDQRIVGRDSELEWLESRLDRALASERQLILLTGEPGIGKTALVEAFLRKVAAKRDVMLARGECLNQYGAGESYLPIFEAISRLARTNSYDCLIPHLRKYAPTWLAHMPSLIGSSEQDALRHEVLGATAERMLGEMAEAIEVITAGKPLVLVLEDLHWSDYSTLDLISWIALRRDPARLMIIATYRPVDVIINNHPLKSVRQELQMKRLCEELPLAYLDEKSVRIYLSSRFPGADFTDELAGVIVRRTNGNPLFMVNVVDYFIARGIIAEVDAEWILNVDPEELETGVPETIRLLIDKQIDSLKECEQRLLEAASVAGMEFSSCAVAAAMDQDIIEVEDGLEEIMRRNHLLRVVGSSVMPDGIEAARYAFVHALYQNVLYDRISGSRRALMHRRIGERGEIIFGNRAADIAVELAMHFERGRDYKKAIAHLKQASGIDSDRYANREAIAHLDHALSLVDRLAEADRAPNRICLLEWLGMIHRARGDMREASLNYQSMVDCALACGDTENAVKGLLYLADALSWSDTEACLSTIEKAVDVSDRCSNRALQSYAQGYYAYWRCMLRGWRDADARAMEAAIEAAREAGDSEMLKLNLTRYINFQSLQSEYRAATESAEEGIRLALELSDAYEYLHCQFFRAHALMHLGRFGAALGALRDALEMARKNGHEVWVNTLQLALARICDQAFDFQSVIDLCETVLARAQESRHGYRQLDSLTMLGLAHLKLGNLNRASRYFDEIKSRFEDGHSALYAGIQMRLQHGLSCYYLAKDDLKAARQEAERLLEIASMPGERTYMALAFRMLSEVSMREQAWNTAEMELSKSLSLVDERESPVAEWRVAASAAQFYELRGDQFKANSYWQRSADVINRLADSLDNAQSLRDLLLSSVDVRKILERADLSSKASSGSAC